MSSSLICSIIVLLYCCIFLSNQLTKKFNQATNFWFKVTCVKFAQIADRRYREITKNRKQNNSKSVYQTLINRYQFHILDWIGYFVPVYCILNVDTSELCLSLTLSENGIDLTDNWMLMLHFHGFISKVLKMWDAKVLTVLHICLLDFLFSHQLFSFQKCYICKFGIITTFWVWFSEL